MLKALDPQDHSNYIFELIPSLRKIEVILGQRIEQRNYFWRHSSSIADKNLKPLNEFEKD